MLELLHSIETELPRLVRDPSGWNSLRVNYHPPFVDRVWRQCGPARLFLHRIHPCEADAALFHPHPWPSAMRILTGTYEMGIGYGRGDAAPPVAARIVSRGPMEYEMIDPDAWHYVRPLGEPAMTVMVAGAPWNRSAPIAAPRLQPLDDAEVRELLAFYAKAYPLGE